jgi:hypothetical protein
MRAKAALFNIADGAPNCHPLRELEGAISSEGLQHRQSDLRSDRAPIMGSADSEL